MNYEKDFIIDRNWIVQIAEELSKCPRKSRITFGGSDKNVEIRCDGDMPYPAGMYAVDSDGAGKITSDHYNIILKMAENPPRIEFSPAGLGGSIGGSWTADDIGSSGGGGE